MPQLALVIQQTRHAQADESALETQADTAVLIGAAYSKGMARVAPEIQCESTYPKRATLTQMVNEMQRILSLQRDASLSDTATQMWSKVGSNFGAVTAGSIARRFRNNIFIRHFTEPESRGDVASANPRRVFSDTYGWIESQHFFDFINFAEARYDTAKCDKQKAFDAAT